MLAGGLYSQGSAGGWYVIFTANACCCTWPVPLQVAHWQPSNAQMQCYVACILPQSWQTERKNHQSIIAGAFGSYCVRPMAVTLSLA